MNTTDKITAQLAEIAALLSTLSEDVASAASTVNLEPELIQEAHLGSLNRVLDTLKSIEGYI